MNISETVLNDVISYHKIDPTLNWSNLEFTVTIMDKIYEDNKKQMGFSNISSYYEDSEIVKKGNLMF